MHILFLTWKDIHHPNAGGAERIMYEYACRLVRRWHTVTWFASAFRWGERETYIEGIHVIRRYTVNTLWMFAWLWYLSFRRKNPVDIIIDEAGGWPNMTPLFVKKDRLFFFVHHIGDGEFREHPWIIGQWARCIYRLLFRFYRHVRCITISRSTRDELTASFWYREENITIIENTTEITPIERIDFSVKTHDFLFLWRLTPIKRPDHAIRAFASIRTSLPPDAHLHIIGKHQDTSYSVSLHALVKSLDIVDRVIFHGFLEHDAFLALMDTSRAILVPSEKEWYGLIVLEANAHGLPAIAYDVPGLRDSVKPWVNGVLIRDHDIEGVWRAMQDMIENEEKYRILSESSLEYRKHLPTWDDLTDRLEKLITQK